MAGHLKLLTHFSDLFLHIGAAIRRNGRAGRQQNPNSLIDATRIDKLPVYRIAKKCCGGRGESVREFVCDVTGWVLACNFQVKLAVAIAKNTNC